MQLDLGLNEGTGFNQVTTLQLANIVDSMDATQFLINQAYFEGENVTITNYSANKQKTPNNKIPLPFARKAINDVVGYSAKPGLIQYIIDQENEQSSIDKYNDIVDESNLWLTTTEVYQDGGVKGEGVELAWLDKDAMIRFSQIPREQCQFFYDDTIEQSLQMSIRAYKQRRMKSDGNPYFKWFAEIYYFDHVDYYEGTEVDEQDLKYNPQKDKDQYGGLYGDAYFDGISWSLTETRENLLGLVQLYPYRINSDRKGLVQPLIPIIDRLDMFGSDSIANAIDRFNDSILTLSKKIDEKTVDNIKEYRVIDDLGTEGDFVKFIAREMDLQSSVEGFKLFERLFYDLGNLINMNDDTFNQKSGIAIAYALVPFENMIAQIETYFNQGLEYRMDIINKYLVLFNLQPLTYSIRWSRNLPFDIANRAEVVVKLKESGLLSDETLLKMFPEDIIKDAKEEIERRDQEYQDRAERQIVTAAALTTEPVDNGDENE